MEYPRIRMIATAAVCLVLAAALAGCGGSQSTPETGAPAASGQALLNERCTTCHDLVRVEGQKTDAAGWEAIVTQMQSQGAQLSEDEKKTLVDYLAETYGE